MPYMNVNDMDEAREDAVYKTNLIDEMASRIEELEEKLVVAEEEIRTENRLNELLREKLQAEAQLITTIAPSASIDVYEVTTDPGAEVVYSDATTRVRDDDQPILITGPGGDYVKEVWPDDVEKVSWNVFEPFLVWGASLSAVSACLIFAFVNYVVKT